MSLPPLPSPGALLVDVDVAAGRLTVTGRLDSRTVRALHTAVSGLLLTEQRRWVLDVAAVTVTDHTGLRAIGASYRRLLRHDRRLTLYGASPELQRVLSRLRLDRHLLEDERVPA
ncbi:STAS domain-containing protein [Geodermatophilus sp. SYSU D00779]